MLRINTYEYTYKCKYEYIWDCASITFQKDLRDIYFWFNYNNNCIELSWETKNGPDVQEFINHREVRRKFHVGENALQMFSIHPKITFYGTTSIL